MTPEIAGNMRGSSVAVSPGGTRSQALDLGLGMRQPINEMRFVPAFGDPAFEAFDLILERLPSRVHGSVPVRVHAGDATRRL